MKTAPFSPRVARSWSSSIEPLEARIAPATISLFGTTGNDTLIVFATGPDSGSYQLNGAVAVPFVGVTHFEFHGGDGDDTLAIFNQNGSVFAPAGGIVFGDDNPSPAAGNLLLVIGGGGAAFSQSWVPGLTPDAGTLSMSNGPTSQVIEYSGVQSIITTASATTLTIAANHGDNAITYGPGASGRGLVAVDGFTPLEFTNMDNLVINALAGADTINLNNPTTPAGLTPGGLKTITVNGGDPTDGDVLIVNGVPGQLDNLRHVPTADHAGSVLNDNGPQPQVNYTGIGLLKLVVQESDGDGHRQDGTTGNDQFNFAVGDAGTGTFTGTMDTNDITGSGPFAMTKTELIGITNANDIDFNFFTPGGTDTLTFHGTDGADKLDVGIGQAGGLGITDTVDGNLPVQLEAFNIASAIVHGHGGSDVFNVTAYATIIALTVDGDEGANALNFTGNINGTTTVDLTAKTISGTNGIHTAYPDFGVVSLIGSGPTAALLVTGTNADDTFAVTPTTVGAGSFFVKTAGLPTGQDVAFSYSGQNVFSVNGGAGGFDVLQILGSEAADNISAVGSLVTVANAGVSKVAIGGGIERLDLFALGGDDRVDLSALAALPTQIYGGDGDDTLIGSPQADLIDGGAGKDVIHAGAGHNTVLNNGPFGFTSPTAYDVSKLPSAVISAKLNNDAFADLVVVNKASGTVSVLLGSASGRFSDPVSFSTGGLLPNSVAVGDFDGDGHLDLAVANGGSKNIGILLGDGGGSFAAATKVAVGKPVLGIQTADLDNDGKFDLAVISGTKVLTLAGAGGGAFQPAKAFATGGTQPVALAIADFNQDTFKDIVTANAGSANVSLLLGSATGLGAAAKFKVGLQPSALVAGDFDNDGAMDLAVTNKGSTFVSILRGNGNAGAVQFQRQLKVANPGKTAPSAIATADLNGDGILDLAIANAATGSFRVLLGIGNGLFAAPVDISLGGGPAMKPSALAIGDFDGDGAADIAVTGLGSGDVSVALQVVG